MESAEQMLFLLMIAELGASQSESTWKGKKEVLGLWTEQTKEPSSGWEWAALMILRRESPLVL